MEYEKLKGIVAGIRNTNDVNDAIERIKKWQNSENNFDINHLFEFKHPDFGIVKFTLLQIAAKNGLTDAVKALVKADKGASEENLTAALHHALSGNHADVVKVLIKAGADIKIINKGNGNTILHWAAKNGHADIAKVLIKADADINTQNVAGNTALHLAVLNGNTESVKALIKAGANFDAQNVTGNTALHLAVLNGNTGLVKTLIKAGANIDAQNVAGNTVLHLAVFKNNVEMVKALKKAGANVAVKNEDGKIPLDYAMNEKVAIREVKGILLEATAKKLFWAVFKRDAKTANNILGDNRLNYKAREGCVVASKRFQILQSGWMKLLFSRKKAYELSRESNETIIKAIRRKQAIGVGIITAPIVGIVVFTAIVLGNSMTALVIAIYGIVGLSVLASGIAAGVIYALKPKTEVEVADKNNGATIIKAIGVGIITASIVGIVVVTPLALVNSIAASIIAIAGIGGLSSGIAVGGIYALTPNTKVEVADEPRQPAQGESVTVQ